MGRDRLTPRMMTGKSVRPDDRVLLCDRAMTVDCGHIGNEIAGLSRCRGTEINRGVPVLSRPFHHW